LTNTGKKTGEEIAELYLGLPSTADVPQPPKQLKGFSKISLKPGRTRHVRLQLDARALSYWNTANHDWEILPGTYRVMAGPSSRDLPLQSSFTVSAD
jgi:beta-glucosidase